MSAWTTSIDEPLLKAGKDIRLKCGSVGEALENRGRILVGLSVPEPSLIDGCFSNFSLLGFVVSPSLASKLFIDWETDFSVLINSEVDSTMVIARFNRKALLWHSSFFFSCAWAILKSFKEHRRESRLIVWLTFSSRDWKIRMMRIGQLKSIIQHWKIMYLEGEAEMLKGH